jgi:hypothetical protein
MVIAQTVALSARRKSVDLLLTRGRPSAWELGCHASLTIVLQVRHHLKLSVCHRQVPRLTLPSGLQRARWHVDATIRLPYYRKRSIAIYATAQARLITSLSPGKE